MVQVASAYIMHQDIYTQFGRGLPPEVQASSGRKMTATHGRTGYALKLDTFIYRVSVLGWTLFEFGWLLAGLPGHLPYVSWNKQIGQIN